MKPAPTLLVASLVWALSACGNGREEVADRTVDADLPVSTAPAPGAMDADPMDRAPDAVGMAPADPAATPAMQSEGDRMALMAVAEVDRHEIATAEAALAKGVEGDVRAYAQTLVDDHTRNLDATRKMMGQQGPVPVAQAAGSGNDAGPGVMERSSAAAPEIAAMQQKHEAERERLSALEGEAFTSAWIESMVKGHEEALAKLDDELIPGAADAQVIRHLTATRAAIAGHLETAQALQGASR